MEPAFVHVQDLEAAEGLAGNDNLAVGQGSTGLARATLDELAAWIREQLPATVDGVDGRTLLPGEGAPVPELGSEGDFYFDLAESRLYGPKLPAGWGNGASLLGKSAYQSALDSGFTGDEAAWAAAVVSNAAAVAVDKAATASAATAAADSAAAAAADKTAAQSAAAAAEDWATGAAASAAAAASIIDDEIDQSAGEAESRTRSASKIGQLIAAAVATKVNSEDLGSAAALNASSLGEQLVTAEGSSAARETLELDDGFLRPEWFGAVGDGVASDQAAFTAMSAHGALNGHLHIRLTKGRTYRLGYQTAGENNRYFNGGKGIDAAGLSSFILDLNGGALKRTSGNLHGAFDPATGEPVNYTAPSAPNPSIATLGSMLFIEGCANVEIRGGTIDGASAEQVMGGTPSSAGYQGSADSIWLRSCERVLIEDVEMLNSLREHINYAYDGLTDSSPRKPFTLRRVTAHHAQRNGIATLGGNDIVFDDCTITFDGAPVAGGALLASLPMAAADFETGGIIRNVRIRGGLYAAGTSGGISITFATGDISGVHLEGATFVGKHTLNKPSIVADKCRFFGQFLLVHGDPDPAKATLFRDCEFSDQTLGDTPLATSTNFIIDLSSSVASPRFRSCVFRLSRLRANLRNSISTDTLVDVTIGTAGLADSGTLIFLGGDHSRMRFTYNNLVDPPETGYLIEASQIASGAGLSTPSAGKLRIGAAMGVGTTGDWDNVTGPAGVTVDTAATGNVSLVVGPARGIYLVDAPITAQRHINLPAPGRQGRRFRLVRSANATGAFNLNLRTSALAVLKALTAAGQWVEAEDDGTAFRVTASGTL